MCVWKKGGGKKGRGVFAHPLDTLLIGLKNVANCSPNNQVERFAWGKLERRKGRSFLVLLCVQEKRFFGWGEEGEGVSPPPVNSYNEIQYKTNRVAKTKKTKQS